MVIYHEYEKPLERDKDREFASGSGITADGISEIQHESLYKLCKVWGYAKYRHPSVVDGTINWDAELFRIMPGILQSGTGDEANGALYEWLSQFPFELPKSEETDIWLAVQEEAGAQSLDSSWISDRAFLGNDLCAYLEKLSQTLISERSNAYASFSNKTPYVEFEDETTRPFDGKDDGVKLLSLFRFWNVYEYYSPNIQITKEDWDKVLWDAIPRMPAAGDYRSYVLAIAEVTAKTGDAHITLSDQDNIMRNYYGNYYLPCSVKAVDGRIVADQTAGDKSGLLPGDVIEAIDGSLLDERIAELSGLLPIPEPDKFLLKMRYQLLQAQNRNAEVSAVRNGESLTLSVDTAESPYGFKNPYKNGLMEQGRIGYIDPSALVDGQLEKLMKTFASTKGIIVDLRYYPSVFIPYLMGEYITPEPTPFASLTFSNKAMPGSFYRQEVSSGAGVLKSVQGDNRTFPAYSGKVMILMDESSMSQSEFTIMALRQSPNAVVIGSPSIGADGNVVRLSLPGSIMMNFTGLGVYTPDGKQTQRVGLEPDVECVPTVEGLRAGRDELIDTAVRMILN